MEAYEMKVYFHASLTQKNKYGEFYTRIDKKLRSLGYEVDSTHVTKQNLDELIERDKNGDSVDQAYEQLLKRINGADIIVCEASYPSSIMTGHVLTMALEKGKPLLCLYHKSSVSGFLRGVEKDRFVVEEYDEHSLENIITLEMRDLEKIPDQRFTMLLPTDIVIKLDEIAESGVSRAEYIRNLIRKDTQKRSVISKGKFNQVETT